MSYIFCAFIAALNLLNSWKSFDDRFLALEKNLLERQEIYESCHKEEEENK